MVKESGPRDRSYAVRRTADWARDNDIIIRRGNHYAILCGDTGQRHGRSFAISEARMAKPKPVDIPAGFPVTHCPPGTAAGAYDREPPSQHWRSRKPLRVAVRCDGCGAENSIEVRRGQRNVKAKCRCGASLNFRWSKCAGGNQMSKQKRTMTKRPKKPVAARRQLSVMSSRASDLANYNPKKGLKEIAVAAHDSPHFK
jgi:hypothetical protein